MTWLSLCYTKILLDSCGGGMIYFNRLVLRTILVILISLTFLEIIWRINTEEPTTTEEPFVWRGNISTYQRDLFPSNLTNWHPIRMGLISYICCWMGVFTLFLCSKHMIYFPLTPTHWHIMWMELTNWVVWDTKLVDWMGPGYLDRLEVVWDKEECCYWHVGVNGK